MAEEKQKAIAITTSDLKDLIQAIREPVKSEKEIQAEKEAEKDRLALRAVMLQQEKNRIAAQEACSHMQPKGGDAATVYVYANGGPTDYLICQHCQKSIYPQSYPAFGIVGEPALYNKLLQVTNGIG